VPAVVSYRVTRSYCTFRTMPPPMDVRTLRLNPSL
jgi:hypothetical protein